MISLWRVWFILYKTYSQLQIFFYRLDRTSGVKRKYWKKKFITSTSRTGEKIALDEWSRLDQRLIEKKIIISLINYCF